MIISRLYLLEYNSSYPLIPRYGDFVTMTNNPLFHQLSAQFQKDGFAILPNKIPAETLAQVKAEIDRFVDEYQPDEHASVFRTDTRDKDRDEAFLTSANGVHGFLEADAFDDHGVLQVPKNRCLNKIGHAMHDLLPHFGELARSSIIKQAFTIGGHESTHIVQSMVIFKQPKIGGVVRWHQDASYLLTQPSSVLGVWIALEEATKENGCLWMAPGMHHSPLRELYTVNWATRQGYLADIDHTPWPSVTDEIPLEVEAGSVVVFHDHMPHRSAANLSTKSRVALTFHGYNPNTTWLPKNWLHRDGMKDFVV